jgi:hypothetical protein
MELRNLIDTHLDLPRLSKDLDECGHFARIWSTRRWTREDQARLFEAAKGFRALTLEDFVPSTVAPRVEVTHIGTNSLPVATHFEKHFFKPAQDGAKDVLFGRNFQALSVFSGPGFYVARPSAEPGEVDFDYAATPAETLDAFGPVKSNAGGISTFVYQGCVDVMRGISSHVTIGRLKRNGHYIDNWFVLVREDVPETPPEAGAAS